MVAAITAEQRPLSRQFDWPFSPEYPLNEESSDHDLVTTVHVDKEQLLTWKKWTRPSLDYLDSRERKIKISTICDEYGTKIISFYEWFDMKLRKHHEDDLKALEALQREYAANEQEDKQKDAT